MKTLGNQKDREEIVRRLETLQPGSQRRWGSMSAHQMVCHLCDSFRLYMGEKKAGTPPARYPRAILRWVALWVPLPWPHGFKTLPELDQQAGGTKPAQFEGDLRELHVLIERFTSKPGKSQWPPHALFGSMSDKGWMRLGYLHTDHHLRQFGA